MSWSCCREFHRPPGLAAFLGFLFYIVYGAGHRGSLVQGFPTGGQRADEGTPIVGEGRCESCAGEGIG